MRDYQDPKMFEPLDDDESKLMAERERGEWLTIPEELFKERKLELEQSAKQTLKKTERATIRLSKTDLDGLKLLAAKEGIGYQTLISSILHKTVMGQIKIH